jgi:uncharacterized protein (TIGR03086 family)
VDVVAMDQLASGRMEALIAAVRPGQWGSPTPCEGWSVRDLVEHVVAGNVKYTGLAGGDDFVPGAPPIDLGDEPATAYRETFDVMASAWREPGALSREIGLPRGQRGPAETAAWIHLAETLCHGWDLATATGQEPGFDDTVVAPCLEECRRRVPPQRPAESPFADATDVSGGPLLDQLAAYLGRSVGG